MIWCIKTYMIAYVKIQKKWRYTIHYVKPTTQLLFKNRFPKGGLGDVPDSDWGDFRCLRAVDISSWFCFFHKVFLAATKQLYEWFSPSVCKQRVSLQPMTSCCMNFAIIVQWIYFTIWKNKEKNCHHYKYHIKSFRYHIKTLQEEFAKKSNISWIWRFIYGHKLPYMKKTRKKKQVCLLHGSWDQILQRYPSVRYTFLTMFTSSYH